MRNHSIDVALVETLGRVVTLIDRLAETHGDECSCHFCQDARGMRYTVELFRTCLDCELVPESDEPETSESLVAAGEFCTA